MRMSIICITGRAARLTPGGMWPLALRPRRQELRERFQRRLGDIMLDAFGICFRGFGRHAERQQQIHHQPVPRPHPGGELLAVLGEENAAIGAGGRQPARASAGRWS